MADHTLHMTNSWVYPHLQMLTHINCYTRENTHSHTRIHARFDNRLIFRFLRELGMITPSPSSRPRHRAYTPSQSYFLWLKTTFIFPSLSLQAIVFQRVTGAFCGIAARVPYIRVSCVLLKSRFREMWLYNCGVERDRAQRCSQRETFGT
jgi:hypothetical protein